MQQDVVPSKTKTFFSWFLCCWFPRLSLTGKLLRSLFDVGHTRRLCDINHHVGSWCSCLHYPAKHPKFLLIIWLQIKKTTPWGFFLLPKRDFWVSGPIATCLHHSLPMPGPFHNISVAKKTTEPPGGNKNHRFLQKTFHFCPSKWTSPAWGPLQQDPWRSSQRGRGIPSIGQ